MKLVTYVFPIFPSRLSDPLVSLSDEKVETSGEREHAAALYLACRHLPPQLLSTPGERAGMLSEAAKTLEKIGDKKRLEECYRLMRSMGTSVQASC